MELTELTLTSLKKIVINPYLIMCFYQSDGNEKLKFGDCVIVKMNNGDILPIQESYDTVRVKLNVTYDKPY